MHLDRFQKAAANGRSVSTQDGDTVTALVQPPRLFSARRAMAFALVRSDQTVVTWGHPMVGGSISDARATEGRSGGRPVFHALGGRSTR